jgi:hypothetical protein
MVSRDLVFIEQRKRTPPDKLYDNAFVTEYDRLMTLVK